MIIFYLFCTYLYSKIISVIYIRSKNFGIYAIYYNRLKNINCFINRKMRRCLQKLQHIVLYFITQHNSLIVCDTTYYVYCENL